MLDRKAAFARKDLQPVALHMRNPCTISVQVDSPFKSVKDLVDAAKAQPEKVRGADSGNMSVNHMAILQLQKLADLKLAAVHFDGTVPSLAALMGGHVEALFADTNATVLTPVKNKQTRIIGYMGQKENPYLAALGAKNLEFQGYRLYQEVSFGLWAPAGVPKEILDIMSGIMKKVTQSEEHKKKVEELGMTLDFMDTQQFTAHWTEMETLVKPLIDLAKQESK